MELIGVLGTQQILNTYVHTCLPLVRLYQVLALPMAVNKLEQFCVCVWHHLTIDLIGLVLNSSINFITSGRGE